ncbi:N-acetylglucosaminyl-diphospho-decaprenol L-rhamnosyltransferase [Luteitalea pratensis]|uniref:N-acetylglucosaminyl-diphospho-decaprenol L-rhamnosyltransferase n=1 Tax=Luteitalea pratensis TaxID=1855912 RepID=A0A143PV76_LUTPR|nr:N-acetylglucosaminyl-diphospho-decaprenol L-rhamnosyltransferase [Luteitalea pratensis]
MIIPTVSQAAHLAACLGALRHAHADSPTPPDVIVVLNGADTAVRDVAHAASGVRIVDSPTNRGFAGGCHLGVRSSVAPFIAFLNDDVLVSPGWLEPLLQTMAERPRAGAVGPRVIGGDGLVQEVGSIIWRDGTTRPFGRGTSRASLAWRWRRRVDYCSACALLVRREAWDAVGGFDEQYHPAYYEDVDFCLALDLVGLEVWVDPRSEVIHAESASSSSHFKQFLFARHHQRLVLQRGALLESRVAAPTEAAHVPLAEAAAVARLEGTGPRVLVVDDRVPSHGIGSGFDRMADMLHGLADCGARVRVLPTELEARFVPSLAGAGIAVVDGGDEAFEREVGASDVVIVSRPNNARRACTLFERLPPERRPRLVYDAEALYHRRLLRQAGLADDDATASLLRTQAAAWLEAEIAIAGCADEIVCVSRDEAAFFEAHGARRVRVMTPWLCRAAPTEASLAGRADIAFVAGWLAGASSPNGDALEWFVTEVLPLVVAEVPWARVRVTGSLPAPLDRFEGMHLHAEGFVPDLADFYRRVRVAIAPLRFGAGVKLKTVEALQYGVPVVATTVGAEGLEGLQGEVIAVHDDAVAFAAAVVARLRDVDTWRAHRAAIDRAMAGVPTSTDWAAWLVDTTMEGADVRHPV